MTRAAARPALDQRPAAAGPPQPLARTPRPEPSWGLPYGVYTTLQNDVLTHA